MRSDKVGEEAFGWWSALQPPPVGPGPGDRGVLARLRRCTTVNEALAVRSAHHLLLRCEATRYNTDAVLTVAIILSHVRHDDPNLTVAKRLALGFVKGERREFLSELRFYRLLAATDPDDVVSQFRRLVALMGQTANVSDLAATLYDWMHERRGERRRRTWQLDYHGAIVAEPEGAYHAEA